MVGAAVQRAVQAGHRCCQARVLVGVARCDGLPCEGRQVAAAVVHVEDVEGPEQLGELGLVCTRHAQHVDEVLDQTEARVRGDGLAPSGADAEDVGDELCGTRDEVESIFVEVTGLPGHPQQGEAVDQPLHRVSVLGERLQDVDDCGVHRGSVCDVRLELGQLGIARELLVVQQVDGCFGVQVGQVRDGVAHVGYAFCWVNAAGPNAPHREAAEAGVEVFLGDLKQDSVFAHCLAPIS